MVIDWWIVAIRKAIDSIRAVLQASTINEQASHHKIKFIDWFDAVALFSTFLNYIRSEYSIYINAFALAFYCWIVCALCMRNEIDHKDLVIDVFFAVCFCCCWCFFCFCYSRIDNCLITSFARNCNVQSHFARGMNDQWGARERQQVEHTLQSQ